jgi:hypothetical protein
MLRIDIEWIDDGGTGHNVMVVRHFERVIARETDHGEPEDNSFTRDYAWIEPLIHKAYQLGKEDRSA